MPSFGQKSNTNLSTCDIRLQRLFRKVVEQFDCSVIEGHRGEERQNFLFDSEQSKVRYPSGKHNAVVSLAADVVPYPVDWEDGERFALFAGYVKGIAEMMGLKIRWGGDWNGDFYTKDTKFFDAPHFELDE